MENKCISTVFPHPQPPWYSGSLKNFANWVKINSGWSLSDSALLHCSGLQAFEAINSVQLWLDRKIPSFHWSFSPQCIETWKKRPCPLGPLFKRQFKLERLRIFLYEFDLKIAASKCAWFCNTNERETSDRFWSRIRAEKTDWTFELTLFTLYQKEFNHWEGTMSVPLSNKLSCSVTLAAFDAAACGRWLHWRREIEKFLSLHWCSLLQNTQTSAASVNENLQCTLCVNNQLVNTVGSLPRGPMCSSVRSTIIIHSSAKSSNNSPAVILQLLKIVLYCCRCEISLVPKY